MIRDSTDRLLALESSVRRFVDERRWQRSKNPKNLAMALAGEVGELLAELQWLDDEEAIDVRHGDQWGGVQDELADVFIYLVQLAAVYEVDLIEIAEAKMAKNAERYPLTR